MRDDEQAAWRTPAVGMVLRAGAEFQTGPRSSITMTMPPDQMIIIDRVGSVKLLEALQSRNKLKVDLGMKYGRVTYQIEAAGLEHDASIRTPSNALAIRGTSATVTDDALGTDIRLKKGQGAANNRFGKKIEMGSAPEKTYGKSPVVMDDTDASPAEHSFKNTNAYASAPSLSRGEELALNVNPDTTAGFAGGLREFRPAGTSESSIAKTRLPLGKGTLAFNLSWVGMGGVTPDLDLFVVPPGGKPLVPGSVPVPIATGGTVGQNDRGGANTTVGVETITFQPSFPLGFYKYGVNYVGTGDPATFKILVLVNGRQVNANFDDTVTPLDPKVDFTIDLTSGGGTTGKSSAALSGNSPGRNPARAAVAVPNRIRQGARIARDTRR